jgi:orotate phosphoribosyltransferase
METTGIKTMTDRFIEKKIIKERFENPFKWPTSNGKEEFHPIFADLRIALGDPILRKECMGEMIKTVDTLPEIHGFHGVKNGGLGFAALLAYHYKKPLYFSFKNEIYEVVDFYKYKPAELGDDHTIITNAPFGLMLGVLIADKNNAPFCYVRKEPNKFGYMNQVEGYVKNSDIAHGFLFKPKIDDGNLPDLIADNLGGILAKVGMAIFEKQFTSDFLVSRAVNRFIPGDRILPVDDVMASGKSLWNEINLLKDHRAKVDHGLVVMNYLFKKTEQLFSKEKIIINSIVDTNKILRSFLYTIEKDKQEALRRWMVDPINWR